jgi:hypothetical protein
MNDYLERAKRILDHQIDSHTGVMYTEDIVFLCTIVQTEALKSLARSAERQAEILSNIAGALEAQSMAISKMNDELRKIEVTMRYS